MCETKAVAVESVQHSSHILTLCETENRTRTDKSGGDNITGTHDDVET